MTRQALPLVVSRVLAMGIGVITPLYLAKTLGLDQYGTYKQLFLICGPLLSVLPLGMVQSLYFFIPREKGSRAVLLQTEIFTVFIGLVGAALIWAGLPFLAERFTNPALLEFRLVLALYVFLSLSGGALETALTSEGRMTAAAVAYVIFEVLRSLSLVVPVILGFGLKGALETLAALTFLRLCVVGVLILKAKGGRPSWAGLKAQLIYALPFGAAMLLDGPQQAAHQYAVAQAVSPALFAIYAVGCFQVPFVGLLYTPTSSVLMIRVGQLDSEGAGMRAVAIFKEATRKLSLVFIPMSALLIVTAPWVIQALFGSKYAAATPIFRVSVLGIVVACFPSDGILRARGKTREILYSYLARAVLTVPLLVILVPRLGMIGGIIAWLIAELVGDFMLLFYVPRALAMGGQAPALSAWMPIKELMQLVGASVVCAILALLVATKVGVVGAALGERASALLEIGIMTAAFLGLLVPSLQTLGLRPMALVAALRR